MQQNIVYTSLSTVCTHTALIFNYWEILNLGKFAVDILCTCHYPCHQVTSSEDTLGNIDGQKIVMHELFNVRLKLYCGKWYKRWKIWLLIVTLTCQTCGCGLLLELLLVVANVLMQCNAQNFLFVVRIIFYFHVKLKMVNMFYSSKSMNRIVRGSVNKCRTWL